jgi:hypothetical protein
MYLATCLNSSRVVRLIGVTLAGCALLLLTADSARSTSILAPTFEEIVARADQVVLARVVAHQSSWVTSRSGRAIVTDVTFAIERTLKGQSRVQRTLEFLGGTVGDDTLTVAGMPEFRLNDRDVLFVRDSGRPASPLVGFSYGRFRVVRDATFGGDTIRTFDGRPLASLADVGNPRPPALIRPLGVLSLEEFLREIESAIRLQERRQ